MDFEIKLIEFLQSGRNQFFDTSFRLISGVASAIGVVVVALLFLFAKKKVCFWYLLSYGLSALVIWILKDQIARVRPYNATNSILCLGGVSADFSFPSGHSGSATAMAIFIGYCLFTYYKSKPARVGIVLGCALFVALVGLSRMYLGMHYLTDVLAGVGISAIFCTFGLILMRLFEKQKKVKNEVKNGSKKS